jgi:hypothetical protein
MKKLCVEMCEKIGSFPASTDTRIADVSNFRAGISLYKNVVHFRHGYRQIRAESSAKYRGQAVAYIRPEAVYSAAKFSNDEPWAGAERRASAARLGPYSSKE